MIDPRAIIEPGAKIGKDVSVGPFSVIGPQVEIGDHTWISSHVVIKGHTQIGSHNKVFQFSSVGEASQDKKYAGENTRLVIGNHNSIREGVTIHLGTIQDAGLTQIGDDNLFMAYVHIAHDCVIGNHCIFANNAALAGHVQIGDYAFLSAFCGVHQYCQVGAHALLAHGSLVTMDVPPYVIVTGGSETSCRGINTVGLKRRGFSAEAIKSISQAYKILYRQGNTIEESLLKLPELVPECQDIQFMIDFLKNSKRGIVR